MAERILVCAITGGRPLLTSRTTAKYLDQFASVGVDTAWVMRADHAAEYEPDAHQIATYDVDWANRYARNHWRHPVAQFTAGGFHGAFTGREWAMRLGAAGGYDAVIQLDDNITSIGPVNSTRTSFQRTASTVEMFALLSDLTFATNVTMCGMQLNSVPAPPEPLVIRPGYPYSAFIEKVSPTRLPYYGPFEDDIMHALDYGLSAAPITAAVVDAFKYNKSYGNKSDGMRVEYDATRGLGLLRRYPKNVRLAVGSRTSSVREKSAGFRHYLNTRGFTPVLITDRERYDTAVKSIARIVDAARHAYHEDSRVKMTKRSTQQVR